MVKATDTKTELPTNTALDIDLDEIFKLYSLSRLARHAKTLPEDPQHLTTLVSYIAGDWDFEFDYFGSESPFKSHYKFESQPHGCFLGRADDLSPVTAVVHTFTKRKVGPTPATFSMSILLRYSRDITSTMSILVWSENTDGDWKLRGYCTEHLKNRNKKEVRFGRVCGLKAPQEG